MPGPLQSALSICIQRVRAGRMPSRYGTISMVDSTWRLVNLSIFTGPRFKYWKGTPDVAQIPVSYMFTSLSIYPRFRKKKSFCRRMHQSVRYFLYDIQDNAMRVLVIYGVFI